MKPILIVGAGPTGLTAALQLARRGISFDIIDAATEPGETSRAITIHARTLEFYQQLGLADAILPLGSRAEGVRIKAKGKDRAFISLGEVGTGLSRFPFVFTLAQDDHERFLVAELEKLGVFVERGVKLTDLDQGDECVTVKLETSTGTATREYGRVLGCDGAHSGVRNALATRFEGGSYEGLFYVADIHAKGTRGGELVANLEAGTFALMMPVRRDGGVRLVGIIEEERKDIIFADLQPEIESVIGLKVERLNWFSIYRVHHRVADGFRDRRVFLLGDAAHLHSPAGGQGMNTGIGDAVNLAWKLAEVAEGRASLALLDTYDLERRPFARKLVKTTDSIFNWVVDKGVTGKFLRGIFLPYVAPHAMRRHFVRRNFFRTTSQIALSYRDGPLSEGQAGNLRAGDRLPWCADPDNYAPLSTLDWHVQIYGQCASAFAAAANAVGLPLATFAWDEIFLEKAFVQDAAYVIRPDGYIGMTLPDQNSGALLAYAEKWMRPLDLGKG